MMVGSTLCKASKTVALKAGVSRDRILSLIRDTVDVGYTDTAVNAKMMRLRWGAYLEH